MTDETLGEKLTALTAVLTFGVGVLTLLLGQPWWWMVFVVGWFILTPAFAVLFDTDDVESLEDAPDVPAVQVHQQVQDSIAGAADTDGLADRQDALDLLRERYAKGELDEATFERKVERLLETESLATAEELLDTEGSPGEAPATSDREQERDRGRDPDRDRDRDRDPA